MDKKSPPAEPLSLPVPSKSRVSCRDMNVTVYCASSSKISESYLNAAWQLGEFLAVSGYTLVCGGGGMGSMKCLADGAISKNGKVIGIMPKFMKDLEWAHPNLAEFVWTETLSERKQKLVADADAVIALPGGSGTWEELFEAFTLKRLGQIGCPIYLLNQNGFYDTLLKMMDRAIEEDFMTADHHQTWTVCESLEVLQERLSSDLRG